MTRFTSASVLFGICSLLPALSRADTFMAYRLAPTANTIFDGMDASGNVLITDMNSGSPLYRLYNGPSLLSSSTVYPSSFLPDNGSYVYGGGRGIRFQIENGSYFASSSSYPPGAELASVYEFTPTGEELVYFGNTSNQNVALNSVGDLTFTDLLAGVRIEVLDTPGSGAPAAVTPEPSSFALLGTGVLATAAMLRRRCKLA